MYVMHHASSERAIVHNGTLYNIFYGTYMLIFNFYFSLYIIINLSMHLYESKIIIIAADACTAAVQFIITILNFQ